MTMTTAIVNLTDPAILTREFTQVREEAEALIKRLDAIEAAQDDIAAAARAAQVNSRTADRLAEDVADTAASTAGHLRMAIATNLKEGERAAKRLTDHVTEASAGRR